MLHDIDTVNDNDGSFSLRWNTNKTTWSYRYVIVYIDTSQQFDCIICCFVQVLSGRVNNNDLWSTLRLANLTMQIIALFVSNNNKHYWTPAIIPVVPGDLIIRQSFWALAKTSEDTFTSFISLLGDRNIGIYIYILMWIPPNRLEPVKLWHTLWGWR